MQTVNELVPWETVRLYVDIKYEKFEGIAKITINRPQVRNAFRPLTVEEMMHAFTDAKYDSEIGVIIITGGLIYFPAVALGPIVEHFLMLGGKLF